MSRPAIEGEFRRFLAAKSAVYLLLIGLLFAASVWADAPGEMRRSQSVSIAEGGRTGQPGSAATNDEYPAISVDEKRSSPGRALAEASADRPASAQSLAWDFWIYDADVIVFGDDDRDGYFYGIDLLFDADTVYDSARVYAVAYLSLNGGPWNEYAVTDDFIINGATSGDEFVLVTELESGYPTGSYDLLIELYDSFTGEFLTDFGPESSSALSFLALEDFNRDAPLFDVPVAASRGNGGGGASGAWLMLGLAGALVWRKRRGSKEAV